MNNDSNSNGRIKLYLDGAAEPVGEFSAPVTFDLDTRELDDGKHTLKIVSTDASGIDGVRIIPFIVRNGPAIDIEGLKEDQSVDGVVPILINAYGKGDQNKFILYGSETPRGIPAWIIVLVVFVLGWGAHYLISFSSISP